MNENISSFITVVEQAIQEMGVNPLETRGAQPGQWTLQKGSVQIILDIFQPIWQGPWFLNVMSPVMQLPISDLELLLEELLRLNHQIPGAGFSVFDQFVFMKAARPLLGMDATEARSLVEIVGSMADYYDEILQEKFPHKRTIGYK